MNEEILPVIRRAREVMNYELVEKADVTTDGTGAATEIWRSPELPTNCGVLAEAKASGSNATGTVAAGVVIRRYFNSAAGVISALGVSTGDAWTTATHVLLDATWNVDASARQVYLTVNDGAYASLDWTAVIKVVTLDRDG